MNDEKPKSSSSDKRKKILIGAGSVMAIAVLYFGYQHFMYVTTDNAQVEAHSVMLAPKVGGFITKVSVTEGDKVKKDDVLVEIDSRDYENSLKQLSSELLSLEARRKDAEKNFKRLSDLYRQGAVSQAQFGTAQAGYLEVRGKYDGLSAQVAQAQLNLENTKIKAPSDGVIARKSAEVGQLASMGVPLLGFVSSDARWVTANFKETEVEHIRKGNIAYIDVDALNGKSFHGEVESLSPATGATFALLPPDNATGNFTKVVQRVPVRIKFSDLSPQDIELLRAGLSVNVKVKKN